jgi:hypothetical protein
MFHVEHCQRTDPGWSNDPQSGQVDAFPAISNFVRWLTDNHYPAGPYELDRPPQSLQRRPETPADRRIKSPLPRHFGADLADISTNGCDLIAFAEQGYCSKEGVDPLLAAIDQGDSQFRASNSNY